METGRSRCGVFSTLLYKSAQKQRRRQERLCLGSYRSGWGGFHEDVHGSGYVQVELSQVKSNQVKVKSTFSPGVTRAFDFFSIVKPDGEE